MAIYAVNADQLQLSPGIEPPSRREPEFVFENGGPRPFGRDLADIIELPPTDQMPHRVGFEPIGLHKPLTIRIEHVYTAKRPSFTRRGLLITSAIKSETDTAGMARSLNFLEHKAPENLHLDCPSALEPGTSLVYYSPAELSPRKFVSIEIAFDNFPEKAFEVVADLSSYAAGLPVMIDHKLALIAAGKAIEIGGKLGNRLVDGRADIQFREEIRLEGVGATASGLYCLTQTDWDPFAEGLTIRDYEELVDSDGVPYAGEEAYIILSVDGAKQPAAYEKFEPAAVSASILRRFMSLNDDSMADTEILQEALALYNDVYYAKQYDALVEHTADLKGEQRQFAEERLKAIKSHIVHQDMWNLKALELATS